MSKKDESSMRSKIKNNQALLFAFWAILGWSTVASAFKLTLSQLEQATQPMLFYSALFSTLALGSVMLVRRKTTHSPSISFSHIKRSALMGFLNPFIYYLVLFKAYSLLPGQEAQPLNYTWPLTLTLLSALFLKEPMRPIQLLPLLISFAGVLVIATRGNVFSLTFSNLPGALLALGSSLIWASYWIINMRALNDAVTRMFLNFLFGFCYIGILNLATGVSFRISIEALAGTAWIGLFEMGLTFVFWMKALELATSSSRVSNLVYLTPFISLFFLRFLVGESILVSSVSGLSLIVFGILIQLRLQPAKQ